MDCGISGANPAPRRIRPRRKKSTPHAFFIPSLHQPQKMRRPNGFTPPRTMHIPHRRTTHGQKRPFEAPPGGFRRSFHIFFHTEKIILSIQEDCVFLQSEKTAKTEELHPKKEKHVFKASKDKKLQVYRRCFH